MLITKIKLERNVKAREMRVILWISCLGWIRRFEGGPIDCWVAAECEAGAGAADPFNIYSASQRYLFQNAVGSKATKRGWPLKRQSFRGTMLHFITLRSLSGKLFTFSIQLTEVSTIVIEKAHWEVVHNKYYFMQCLPFTIIILSDICLIID